MDSQTLASKLFDTIGHRPEVVVFISTRLAVGSDEQREVAYALSDILLEQFLASLGRAIADSTGDLPTRNRRHYLQHIGKTVARQTSPTDFVRNKLNPVLHSLVELIETQRFEHGLSFAVIERGLCVAIVALEVAIRSGAAEKHFRVGMASDYIHWLGRLTRSDAASTRFGKANLLRDRARDDLLFAA
jgi:hypothetical protein